MFSGDIEFKSLNISIYSSSDLKINQLSVVLEAINGMYCVYDTHGKIMFINNNCRDFLGIPEGT